MKSCAMLIILSVLFIQYSSIAQRPGVPIPLFQADSYTDSAIIVVQPGWNLVSLPIQPADGNLTAVFPTAHSWAWQYDGQYKKIFQLEQGNAYWISFASHDSIVIRGQSRNTVDVALHQGWNLVGPLSKPIPVDSLRTDLDGIVSGSLYSFNPGSGYSVADTLFSGKGYWIKVSQASTLSIGNEPASIYTPADSLEAREMAVWYSGALRPPGDVTQFFLAEMKYLRQRYHDSIMSGPIHVVSEHRFLAPWVLSAVSLVFDATTAQLVRDELYTGWNQLDSSLRPFSCSPPDRWNWSYVRCAGVLHPRRLAEFYAQLPGVLGAYEETFGFYLDYDFPLFVRPDGDGFLYIFTLEWGFNFGPWWAFSTQSGVPEYLGVRNPGDPNPPWWVHYTTLDEDFRSWDGP